MAPKKQKQALHAVLTGILIGLLVSGSGLSFLLLREASQQIQTSTINHPTTSLEQSQSKKTQKSKPTAQGKKSKVKRIAQKPRRLKSQQVASNVVPAEEKIATITKSISCEYEAPEKPNYGAELISREIRVDAVQDERIKVTILLKNTGNVPWFGDSSGCSQQKYIRLGTAMPKDRDSIFYSATESNWVAPNRIALDNARINPGEIGSFTIVGRAPKSNDLYREYFQPVVEGISWIDDRKAAAVVDVYIGRMHGAAVENLQYFRFSGRLSDIDLSADKKIEVDISEQTLKLKLADLIIAEYKVSTGTFKTPTPLGNFKIVNKQELRIGAAKPHYRMPNWNGFTARGHGFHSLPYLANDNGVFWKEALNHIGQRVSHGCVRLLPEDAEDFHTLTEIGMPVVIQA